MNGIQLSTFDTYCIIDVSRGELIPLILENSTVSQCGKFKLSAFGYEVVY